MKMKTRLNTCHMAATVAAVMFALLTGCSNAKSSGQGDKTPAAKSEKEGQAEPVADQGKGAQAANSEKDVKAEPIGLKDFPKPEGTEVTMTTADTRTIMMRGPNEFDAHRKFYETKLGELGWTKNDAKSEVVEGIGFLEFEKGKLSITITLNPARDGKAMTIFAQGTGVSVPEENEAS